MDTRPDLSRLGFHEYFREAGAGYIEKGFEIARVTAERRELYRISVGDTEISAEVTGSIMFSATSRADFPAVGDWVAVTISEDRNRAVIHFLLPRYSVLKRKTAGRKFEEQIIASNIDRVFIVHGFDAVFNVRRLERYLLAVKQSGADPVFLLSKRDLVPADVVSACMEKVGEISSEIHSISYNAFDRDDIERIQAFIKPGTTACCIGPSGSGKSTLINRLAGEDLLSTSEVRSEQAKGKHTTTMRQMVLLPGGGILIDTPGMREFAPWDAGEMLLNAFEELLDLSTECRFNDCTHMHEPGCAVIRAVEDGTITRNRYDSFIKLAREQDYHAAMAEKQVRLKRKEKERKLSKEQKKITKHKHRSEGTE